MSCAPRPFMRPSRTTGSKGARIPSTPTVSICPQNINDGPGAPLSRTAITFDRPAAASCKYCDAATKPLAMLRDERRYFRLPRPAPDK